MLASYSEAVARDDRATFVARFPHPFLLKRPLVVKVDAPERSSNGNWQYRTTLRREVHLVSHVSRSSLPRLLPRTTVCST